MVSSAFPSAESSCREGKNTYGRYCGTRSVVDQHATVTPSGLEVEFALEVVLRNLQDLQDVVVRIHEIQRGGGAGVSRILLRNSAGHDIAAWRGPDNTTCGFRLRGSGFTFVHPFGLPQFVSRVHIETHSKLSIASVTLAAASTNVTTANVWLRVCTALALVLTGYLWGMVEWRITSSPLQRFLIPFMALSVGCCVALAATLPLVWQQMQRRPWDQWGPVEYFLWPCCLFGVPVACIAAYSDCDRMRQVKAHSLSDTEIDNWVRCTRETWWQQTRMSWSERRLCPPAVTLTVCAVCLQLMLVTIDGQQVDFLSIVMTTGSVIGAFGMYTDTFALNHRMTQLHRCRGPEVLATPVVVRPPPLQRCSGNHHPGPLIPITAPQKTCCAACRVSPSPLE